MKILKNKHNIKLSIIGAFVAILFFTSCLSQKQNTKPQTNYSYKYNFASLYNPSLSDLHPEVRIYTKLNNEATIFYRVLTKEIKAITNSQFDEFAKLTIKYTLRNVNTFAIVDSGTIINNIDLKELNGYFRSYFNVKQMGNDNYKIIISFFGEKPNSGKRLLLDINFNENNEYVFLPMILIDNKKEILFHNFVNHKQKYIINSNIAGNNLKIDYYKFPEHLHLAPFYTTNTQNTFVTPEKTIEYKLNDTIIFEEKGVYIIRRLNQNSGGLCLINAGEYFPEVKTVEAMLEPLKLLISNKEYNEIKNSDNLKYSIDNFWLSKSQNERFAKEQIRVFYNRVNLANTFFTEDKEGWKTDRGMIYIMFGPPAIIYISANQEEWFYGEDPDVAGIFFLFDRLEKPLYFNSWVLKRDASYQTIWAQALQTWKNGRVFTISN